ncbi:YiiX/YebB-like N1pC/P60 family cysteine hydrolase [Kolteria novifilia]
MKSRQIELITRLSRAALLAALPAHRATLLIAFWVLSVAGCCSKGPLVAAHCPGSHRVLCPIRQREEVDHTWDQWAKDHLQSGDIVFGMGDARACMGLFRFSRVSTRMAASRYSHTGLISCEDGEVYVYDMAPEGARRKRFSQYLVEDNVMNLAVKRLSPEKRHLAEAAVKYCQDVYERQPNFDRQFVMGPEKLYCTEMVVLAYRSAGIDLCEPIRIDEFPNYDKFPITTFIGRLVPPFTPETQVFVPGNEQIGIWSSPDLDVVYEECHFEHNQPEPTVQQVADRSRQIF